jgi:hypothetical protein
MYHVKEAGADAKLIQHGPLGVAHYGRHPISTIPVTRITAHATVPGHDFVSLLYSFPYLKHYNIIHNLGQEEVT